MKISLYLQLKKERDIPSSMYNYKNQEHPTNSVKRLGMSLYCFPVSFRAFLRVVLTYTVKSFRIF